MRLSVPVYTIPELNQGLAPCLRLRASTHARLHGPWFKISPAAPRIASSAPAVVAMRSAEARLGTELIVVGTRWDMYRSHSPITIFVEW